MEMSTETTMKKGKVAPPPAATTAEVATTAPGATALTTADDLSKGSWGSENIDTADIIIPKILNMQGLSKMVTSEKAKLGELRDSMTGALLGGRGTPVEIVCFHTFKQWITFEDHNGKLKYVRTEPMTAKNMNLPTEEGGLRRDRAMNVYALLTKDIEAGEFFPRCLSFRRTSYQAGKTISTIATKLKMFNKPLAATVFNLDTEKQENEKGAYYVFTVSEKRPATETELKAAYSWYKLVTAATANITVHEAEDVETVPTEPVSNVAENGMEV